MFDYNSGCFFLTNFGDFLLTRNGYNRLTLTDNNEEEAEEAVYFDDFFDKDNIKIMKAFKNYYYSDNVNEKEKVSYIDTLYSYENQRDGNRYTTTNAFNCYDNCIVFMFNPDYISYDCFHCYYYNNNNEKKEFWFRVR